MHLPFLILYAQQSALLAEKSYNLHFNASIPNDTRHSC
jgi:hypothetical protein